jgi:RecA-family ATPase
MNEPNVQSITVQNNGSDSQPLLVKEKINLHGSKEFFYSIEQWDSVDLDTEDNAVLIGTPKNPIIRPGTKNLIEAPEKTFKTTFSLRQFIGMASGHTVYPSLPVARPVRVLYIHGEMTPQELKERRDAAQVGIPPELLKVGRKNFIDGRSLDAHLIRNDGQNVLRTIVKKFKPDVLVIDPWQSFISGYDESSFKDMSQAHEFLDKLLVEQNGMTLFIVEHLGKDHSKGMRGHSSTAGWRDTLIRLKRKNGQTEKIQVDVRPRWASPVTFGLKFHANTMVEGGAFSAQSVKIRAFLEKRGGYVPRAEIEAFLGGEKKTAQKAVQRAVEEQAIAEGGQANKGKFTVFLDDEEVYGPSAA